MHEEGFNSQIRAVMISTEQEPGQNKNMQLSTELTWIISVQLYFLNQSSKGIMTCTQNTMQCS